MAKTQYIVKVTDNTIEDTPHFYSHTTNPKQRISRIKEVLAQSEVPYEHMKAFKGKQDFLTFETYKHAYTLKFDDIKI
jgi:hypothetical protein